MGSFFSEILSKMERKDKKKRMEKGSRWWLSHGEGFFLVERGHFGMAVVRWVAAGGEQERRKRGVFYVVFR